MAFTQTYGDIFTFAGETVEYQCESISGEATALIRDYVRKGEHGQAEIVLIGAAVLTLKVGSETIIRRSSRSQRRAGKEKTSTQLPNLFDEKASWESLTDVLLKAIVKHEFWLAMKEPFDAAFSQYFEESEDADEFEAEKVDPT